MTTTLYLRARVVLITLSSVPTTKRVAFVAYLNRQAITYLEMSNKEIYILLTISLQIRAHLRSVLLFLDNPKQSDSGC